MGRYMDIVNQFLRERELETGGFHADADAKKAKEAKKAPQVHGIALDELEELAGPEWIEMRNDPELLKAFAHAVATRRLRESGTVPVFYTSTTICSACGEVPVWESCPPKVANCPWCFNRVKGLPVPFVKKLERVTR